MSTQSDEEYARQQADKYFEASPYRPLVAVILAAIQRGREQCEKELLADELKRNQPKPAPGHGQ